MRVARFSTSSPVAAGNAAEMAHFAELAQSWWDPNGPQRVLNKMNWMRMDYIADTLRETAPKAPGYSLDLLPTEMRELFKEPNKKLKVLDIGCGGGLLSESLARRPYVKSVLGIDVTPEVVQVAKEHKKLDPKLSHLSYKQSTVEALDSKHKFDIITMFEVLEHLDDPPATLRAALDLLNPGGYIFMSTINRTPISYFTTILVAEHLMKMVPVGTHTWSKYINEAELRQWIDEQSDMDFVSSEGCMFVPGTQSWVRFGPRSSDLCGQALNKTIGKEGGNYLFAARKRASPHSPH